MTCENEDKIADPGFKNFPAVPCYLEEWVKDNKNQQFIFDRESGIIKDAAHSFELCKQGNELSLCDFSGAAETGSFQKYHTKWRYDGVSQTLKHISDWVTHSHTFITLPNGPRSSWTPTFTKIAIQLTTST